MVVGFTITQGEYINLEFSLFQTVYFKLSISKLITNALRCSHHESMSITDVFGMNWISFSAVLRPTSKKPLVRSFGVKRPPLHRFRTSFYARKFVFTVLFLPQSNYDFTNWYSQLHINFVLNCSILLIVMIKKLKKKKISWDSSDSILNLNHFISVLIVLKLVRKDLNVYFYDELRNLKEYYVMNFLEFVKEVEK